MNFDTNKSKIKKIKIKKIKSKTNKNLQNPKFFNLDVKFFKKIIWASFKATVTINLNLKNQKT
jgi:hypothetical protein